MSDKSNNIGSGRSGKKKDYIKVGRHGAEALVPNPEENEKMMSKFVFKGNSPITTKEKIRRVRELISYAMGIDPDEAPVPDKIGFEISDDSQRRVLFGVLNMMTETNYQGNFTIPYDDVPNNPVKLKNNKEEVVLGSSNPTIGNPYKNIDRFPVLRNTKRELMQGCGFDPDDKNDQRLFSKAYTALWTDRYFLMWKRFKRNEDGSRLVVGKKFYTDKNGRKKWKGGRSEFELVSTIDTIFKVKVIHDPVTLKPVAYETTPNPIFLDEISPEYGGERGNFLLVPKDSLDEIEQAYRKRFPSSRGFVPQRVQNFCFWLRLKVLEIQNKNRNPFTTRQRGSKLRVKYLSLCQYLGITLESAKKNKTQHQKYIDLGTEIAKEIGYLKDGGLNIVDPNEYVFDLNLEYFPNEYKETSETEKQP